MTSLVLVPGLMCDETVWEAQIEALSDVAACRVADAGSLDSLGAMAAAILEEAPPRFALAGHSMGGRVALEVMRKAPERVEKLAILDSNFKPLAAGAAGEQEAAGRYRLLAKARKEGVRAMAAEWVQGMIHPDRKSDTALVTAIMDMFERKTADIFEAQIRALLNRPDAGPLLADIRVPTLILCGCEDAWSPVAVHEEMAARIASSKLVAVAQSGHMTTMEQPGEVGKAMREWLLSG
ncbi:MAG TPA: alpha/beta hydrolase [Bryobacteraceae bacterium]|nr:alpha/beta hydrolase [Bryobacteraceae bacterium]